MTPRRSVERFTQKPLCRDIYSAEGFVHKTTDANVIEFSPSHPFALCLYWIKIPLRMIDKVQLLGKRQCLNHLHDYVILYFKRAENPEAAVFAELFHHEANTRAAAMPTAPAIGTEGGDIDGMTLDATAMAAVDCVVVRIFSFVGGGLIHQEVVRQPNLAQKVNNILRSWGAQPYGMNRPVISNC